MNTRDLGVLGAVVSCALAMSCLPQENRSPPGRLLVKVSGDDALRSGLSSADGWSIVYDRFLLSVGNVEMRQPSDDDSATTCIRYSEDSTSYLRLIDLKEPGPQLVATTFALGECAPAFQLMGIMDDALLGDGVDESDRTFMTEVGTDHFAEDANSVLYVAGRATRADATVRFRWSFRRGLAYMHCEDVPMRADETQVTDIRIQTSVLFQDRLDEATAELRFDPYAAADGDGDGDGEVTLEELGAATRAASDGFPTLADLLYTGLVPRLPRAHPGVKCTARALDTPPRDPGP